MRKHLVPDYVTEQSVPSGCQFSTTQRQQLNGEVLQARHMAYWQGAALCEAAAVQYMWYLGGPAWLSDCLQQGMAVGFLHVSQILAWHPSPGQ